MLARFQTLKQHKKERRRARNEGPPGSALVSDRALKSHSVFDYAMIMPQVDDSALLDRRASGNTRTERPSKVPSSLSNLKAALPNSF